MDVNLGEDIREYCLQNRMGTFMGPDHTDGNCFMGPDHTDELDADNTVQAVQQINRPVKCNKTVWRDVIGTDVRPGRCWLSNTKKQTATKLFNNIKCKTKLP